MASSRHEADTISFPVAVYFVVPVLALGLQSFLSLHFPQFDVVDLPLLVTIYYAISRRQPVAATLTGTAIGVAQDALTQHPLGVFGIAKAIVGYVAASLGVRVDTENHGSRLLLTFGFTMAQTGILWLLQRRLLGQPMAWHGVHEAIRAVANSLLGVVLYALLDRFRRREY